MRSLCKRHLGSCAAGLSLFLVWLQAAAVPVTIDYSLTALAAPSRYEYRYTVSNDSSATPVGWFSIDFDTALYQESSLLITSVGVGGWSQQILSSVFANPAQYDAYKTASAPLAMGESATGFAVQFTWLGSGAPGAQAFTVYDPANLNVIDTGFTTLLDGPVSPIPEPSTVVLMLMGLCGAAAVKRRRQA
jgi:hypothetical protein